jgi:hypothetical protein
MSFFGKIFNGTAEIDVKSVFRYEYALDYYENNLVSLYKTLIGKAVADINTTDYTEDDYKRDVFHIVATAKVEGHDGSSYLFDSLQDLVSTYNYYFRHDKVTLEAAMTALLVSRLSKLPMKQYETAIAFHHLRVHGSEITVLYGKLDVNMSDFAKGTSNSRLTVRPQQNEKIISDTGNTVRSGGNLTTIIPHVEVHPQNP